MPYIKALESFVGKVCTVSTVAINFRFQEQPMMEYFLGMVDAIDEYGILMTHPTTKCRNYIFLAHVVGIHEEQVLYESDPEHKKIIEEYRKEKPITAAKTAIPAPQQSKFVNAAAMAALAKQAKEAYAKEQL